MGCTLGVGDGAGTSLDVMVTISGSSVAELSDVGCEDVLDEDSSDVDASFTTFDGSAASSLCEAATIGSPSPDDLRLAEPAGCSLGMGDGASAFLDVMVTISVAAPCASKVVAVNLREGASA